MQFATLFNLRKFLDRFLGSDASLTTAWLSWVTIVAILAFGGCLFQLWFHSRQLRNAANIGLPASDNYGNDYINKRLKELGTDGEEDGRVLLVLRIGLWVLFWLLIAAVAFFWAGETRGRSKEIEDGSFIFRNNEGFTAALALIIALASSAMAPIYVELLNRRRAAELQQQAAFERLQQSLRQTSQRMEAVWSHFEGVLFPFAKDWLTFLANVPATGPKIATSARNEEAQFCLAKQDIESVAESFSELLHGDALFKSYLESEQMAPEDRSAFFFLLRQWRHEGRRVPWGDEISNGVGKFYSRGTVFTKEGQSDAEKRLLSIADTDSPLRQVLRWAETGQPDFVQSAKTSNYYKLRDLREGWVTAHALLKMPKRDIRGPNAGEWEEKEDVQPGDWYSWMSDGQTLCDAPAGTRNREIDTYYPSFSSGLKSFFPSSETTLVPLIWATNKARDRMNDKVPWSVRSLWQLRRELEQRMRRHLDLLEQNVANVKLAGEQLGLNVESLLDDVELFRALCSTLDRMNSLEPHSEPPYKAASPETASPTKGSSAADLVSRDWVVSDLAQLLYYGVVLLHMRKKEESTGAGEAFSTWQFVEKYLHETIIRAEEVRDALVAGQPCHESPDNWDTTRRILEASRARTAVHNLSRAALSVKRRENLVAESSDFLSGSPLVRLEIRLAALQRRSEMPVVPTTRLRLVPLAEIESPEPPQFLKMELDEIVIKVLERRSASAGAMAVEQI